MLSEVKRRVPGVLASAVRRGSAGMRSSSSRPEWAASPAGWLLEAASLDEEHRQRLSEYMAAGVEVKVADSLP